MLRKDGQRVIQPITAATIREDDIWLFLQDFKRIEAPGCMPLPMDEAANQLLRTFGLTPRGAAPALYGPLPTDDAHDLVKRGRALLSNSIYTHKESPSERADQALPLFRRAVQLDPHNASAWYWEGIALCMQDRYEEALTDFTHATKRDPNYADAWAEFGNTLSALCRPEKALAAYDRALALDPTINRAWNGKVAVLRKLGRTTEAEAAEQRAMGMSIQIRQILSREKQRATRPLPWVPYLMRAD